ncbi:MAG: helix-turn-helix transcriptional regulator [Gammaproteobacteria bacterium]
MIIPLRLLNLEKHSFITSSEQIRKIANPLIILGIRHFAYQRKHKDGSVELLGTHPDFTKKFIENKLYRHTFCGEIENYSNCYAFWEDIDCKEIIQLAKESSNLTNGIVATKPSKNYCDFYYFASSPSDSLTKTFYINNIELLEKFILYFNEVAKPILRVSKRQRILYPNSNDLTLLASKNVLNINEKSYSVDKTLDDFYYLDLMHLTKKETKICKYIKNGYSSKEIAQFEKLSYRTVEKHIDHIKQKFMCDSILKLIHKLNISPKKL